MKQYYIQKGNDSINSAMEFLAVKPHVQDQSNKELANIAITWVHALSASSNIWKFHSIHNIRIKFKYKGDHVPNIQRMLTNPIFPSKQKVNDLFQ